MSVMELRRKIRLRRNLIERAFIDARYPGDSGLLHPDYPGAQREIESFRKQLWNRNWRDVPYEIIEEKCSSLLFFSAEAFRFYLPAYMNHSLRLQQEGLPNRVLEFTLRALNPEWHNTEFLRYFLSRVERFTKRQENAVHSFLETVRNHNDNEAILREAGQALERYWGEVQFLAANDYVHLFEDSHH